MDFWANIEVHRPSHHDVELALSCVPAHRIEGRALFPALGTANPVVLVDVDDFPAHAACNGLQLPFLVGCGLVDGRNPTFSNPILPTFIEVFE